MLRKTNVHTVEQRIESVKFCELEVGAYFTVNNALYRKISLPKGEVVAMQISDMSMFEFDDDAYVEHIPAVEISFMPR